MVHVAVIGSGPSAFAASLALLRRGATVTVLDAGVTLDEHRAQLVADLRREQPEQWDQSVVEHLINNPTVETQSVPRKLVFGSDYIYARTHPDGPIELEGGVDAYPTLARGGYTTAWGGAMLPTDDCDMTDWPIGSAELEPSYRRVLAELPLSAVEDGLAQRFPLFKRALDPLALPAESSALLSDLERVDSENSNPQFLFGRARLAVNGPSHAHACRYCGLCLHSCPYDAIFGTAERFEALARENRIEYVGGAIVRWLTESPDHVHLHFQLNGENASRSFDRVFVGAGAIGSTRLMLESMHLHGEPCVLKQSHKFVLPLLRFRRAPISWPKVNTLASLFLELKLRSLSDHWSHIQVSPVNDFMLRRLGVDPSSFAEGEKPWFTPFLERLMIAWCGIHSDHSSRITVTLTKTGGDGSGTLRLDHEPAPEEQRYSRKLAYALARKGWRFRSAFLAPLRIDSKPGAGNHVGGSFPMARTPATKFQTDVMGRPQGLNRVHLIDSAVFPSIPATTLLLPIMANADRIASQATLA